MTRIKLLYLSALGANLRQLSRTKEYKSNTLIQISMMDLSSFVL
jgi:hypothetical protein